MLDCHVNDPKTRSGSQQDFKFNVVIIKAHSTGNGLSRSADDENRYKSCLKVNKQLKELKLYIMKNT